MNIRDLPIVLEIGHVPLLGPEWTLLRDGWDLPEQQPFAEWECAAPVCRVLVRTVVAPADDAMPDRTVWQQTVVWHERETPSEPIREPSLGWLDEVKNLFVGTKREAVLVFPPHTEVSTATGAHVSLFTCLGYPDYARPAVVRTTPRFFSFLPPLP